MQLFQLVETLPKFLIAETNPTWPTSQLMQRLKNLSRQLLFNDPLFQLRKLALQTTDLKPALGKHIDQGAHQKVPFRTKAFPLPFVGNPLVPKNRQDLADLLKNLPSQAPALFALPKAFVDVNMFIRTYLPPLLSTYFSGLREAENVHSDGPLCLLISLRIN
jgi:hypothetical protein